MLDNWRYSDTDTAALGSVKHIGDQVPLLELLCTQYGQGPAAGVVAGAVAKGSRKPLSMVLVCL